MKVLAVARAGERGLAARVAETAAFQAQIERRRAASGRTHEVDRAAERRGAVLQRVRAAEDLDVARGERLDRLEVATAVGLIEIDAVLQQFESAQMERPLQTRAAHRQARFLGAEARLHEDAGRIAECVGQGARALLAIALRIDDGRAAGDLAEPLLRRDDFGVARIGFDLDARQAPAARVPRIGGDRRRGAQDERDRSGQRQQRHAGNSG